LPNQHTRENTEEKVPEMGIGVPLDLPEFRVVEQLGPDEGILRVKVMAKTTTAPCPHCQQTSRYVHDCRERRKRDLQVRDYQICLIVLKRRYRCFSCAKTFTEPDEACGPRRRTTCRLREAIGRQAASQPVASVSQSFGVGPRFVRTCWQSTIGPQLARKGLDPSPQAPLPASRFLGIDEFAIQKGHRYASILCDLEHRKVVEVSRGRQFFEVVRLLGRLDHPEVVEAVSLDMSASFAPAVRFALPHAQLVIDHFHVIQHVMKAFRKVVSRWAHKKEGTILLHHKQQVFLKAVEDLTDDEKHDLARIASRLPALETAWKLKEALRTWYAEATVETAEEKLDDWIKQVRQQGPEPMQQALSAFTNWRQEILAFFRFLPTRISNGYVEGKNNRTKAMMRQAYGYRNFQHLRLRILSEGKYEP
jgi:transposase